VADVSIDFFAIPKLEKLDYMHDVLTTGVVWASSEPTVALRGYDKSKLAIWRIDDSRPEHVIETSLTINAFAFSPDSKLIAVGTDDALAIFDRAKRQQIFHAKGRVISVDFSPDHSSVAAGGSDGVVRVFPLASGASKRSQ
jgi:WD40 repeat protein